ncbi:hypothetical protein ACOME3_002081 [Neoechinorhynchus agilis]
MVIKVAVHFAEKMSQSFTSKVENRSKLGLDEMASLLVTSIPFTEAERLINVQKHRTLVENFFNGKWSRLVFYTLVDDIAIRLNSPYEHDHMSSTDLTEESETIASDHGGSIREFPSTLSYGKSVLSMERRTTRRSNMSYKYSSHSASTMSLIGQPMMPMTENGEWIELDKENLKEMIASRFFPSERCAMVLYFENPLLCTINSASDFRKNILSQFAMYTFDPFKIDYHILSLSPEKNHHCKINNYQFASSLNN